MRKCRGKVPNSGRQREHPTPVDVPDVSGHVPVQTSPTARPPDPTRRRPRSRHHCPCSRRARRGLPADCSRYWRASCSEPRPEIGPRNDLYRRCRPWRPDCRCRLAPCSRRRRSIAINAGTVLPPARHSRPAHTIRHHARRRAHDGRAREPYRHLPTQACLHILLTRSLATRPCAQPAVVLAPPAPPQHPGPARPPRPRSRGAEPLPHEPSPHHDARAAGQLARQDRRLVEIAG